MPFKPGQSGCPGGLGTQIQKHRKQIRELFAKSVPQAVAAVEKMLKSKKPAERMFAVSEVLNRVYGKPAQEVQLADPEGNKLEISVKLVK